mgnify:CR=1 FL=1
MSRPSAESMVTASNRVFHELGLFEMLEREGFPKKYGAAWHPTFRDEEVDIAEAFGEAADGQRNSDEHRCSTAAAESAYDGALFRGAERSSEALRKAFRNGGLLHRVQ